MKLAKPSKLAYIPWKGGEIVGYLMIIVLLLVASECVRRYKAVTGALDERDRDSTFSLQAQRQSKQYVCWTVACFIAAAFTTAHLFNGSTHSNVATLLALFGSYMTVIAATKKFALPGNYHYRLLGSIIIGYCACKGIYESVECIALWLLIRYVLEEMPVRRLALN